MSKLIDEIMQCYDDMEFLKAEGFDDAVIGVSQNFQLIYSETKAIRILMDKNGWNYRDALEYFGHNVRDAYIGPNTPIWCDDDFNASEV